MKLLEAQLNEGEDEADEELKQAMKNMTVEHGERRPDEDPFKK